MDDARRKRRLAVGILILMMLTAGTFIAPNAPQLYVAMVYGPWELETVNEQQLILRGGATLQTSAGVLSADEIRISQLSGGTPSVVTVSGGKTESIQLDTRGFVVSGNGTAGLVTGNQGLTYRKVRRKRIRWLPGNPMVIRQLTREQYEALGGEVD